MKVKNILLAILVVVLFVVVEILFMGYAQKSREHVQNPIVTMEIENYGTVKMELYPEFAPNTVANFVKLVNEGFYNGLTYHRVIPDVLIQGGDREGTGSGKEDFSIKGEFLANGFKQNTLRHVEGTVSMARADYSSLDPSLTDDGYNSAGTQFFICLANSGGYDGIYAAFGKVTEGLDIIRQISNVERTEENGQTPKEAPVIKSMTVDTFGVQYDEPERHTPFDYNAYISELYGNSNSIIIPE